MSTFTIAIIVVGVCTNLTCFLFGMIAGRNTAYKTVRTFEIADTVHDMPSVNNTNFIGR